jgi:transposase
VILDNLGSHKGKAVRQAIRTVGARLLFLPKDSPDLNPIEQVLPNSKPCCERPAPAHKKPSQTPQCDPRSIPYEGKRRLSQKRRICANRNAKQIQAILLGFIA